MSDLDCTTPHERYNELVEANEAKLSELGAKGLIVGPQGQLANDLRNVRATILLDLLPETLAPLFRDQFELAYETAVSQFLEGVEKQIGPKLHVPGAEHLVLPGM